METVRMCNVCRQEKDLHTGFRKVISKSTGKQYYSHTCRGCYSIRTAKLSKSTPEKIEKRKMHQRESNRKLKTEVMRHYGGKCACCGESAVRFLTIDHLNGCGRKDREMVKSTMSSSGSYYYRWIRDTGYPTHLQVLCFQCNCGRMINGGICPHKDNYQGGDVL